MADNFVDFSEVLVDTLEKMVRKIGESVAAAQVNLDRACLEAQKQLGQSHPELVEAGYQVTWYQLPEVVVDLKVAAHYESQKEEAGSRKAGFFIAPFNAQYKNVFSFAQEGTSTLKLRIVPTTPPLSLQESLVVRNQEGD